MKVYKYKLKLGRQIPFKNIKKTMKILDFINMVNMAPLFQSFSFTQVFIILFPTIT